MEDSITF